MTKKAVIRCILSILMIAYLGVGIVVANRMARQAHSRGLAIEVMEAPASRHFVTDAEVERLLREWQLSIDTPLVADIPVAEIERRLAALDNIESAVCARRADDKLLVRVTPMIPVARVFEPSGRSYYINRYGKRLTANARFRLDVPVVVGRFSDRHPATEVLPVLDFIARDTTWSSLVSTVKVDDRTRDIILVPIIRGHVINLGDTLDLPDKFSRVMTMYHKVLPMKGWNFYDTISAKFRGQIVASRRVKASPGPLINFDAEGELEAPDIDSMLGENDSAYVAYKQPTPNPSGATNK